MKAGAAVKRHTIGAIQRAAAGHLFVRQNGFDEEKDAFEQARDAMFDVRHVVKRRKRQPGDLPILEAVDDFSIDTTGRASLYVGSTRAKYLLILSGIDRGLSGVGMFSEAQNALSALDSYDRVH